MHARACVNHQCACSLPLPTSSSEQVNMEVECAFVKDVLQVRRRSAAIAAPCVLLRLVELPACLADARCSSRACPAPPTAPPSLPALTVCPSLPPSSPPCAGRRRVRDAAQARVLQPRGLPLQGRRLNSISRIEQLVCDWRGSLDRRHNFPPLAAAAALVPPFLLPSSPDRALPCTTANRTSTLPLQTALPDTPPL